MKAKINKTACDDLAAGKCGALISDTEIRGFAAELLPSGAVSFRLRYYNEAGQRRNARLGIFGNVTADQARTKAKEKAGLAAGGADPVEEKKQSKKRTGNTVNTVLDRFEVAHCANIKSGVHVVAAFRRLVRPVIGALVIYDVKRRDVTEMLDKIAAENGPVQSDRVLAYVRKAFHWYTIQDEDFRSPMVRGMERTNSAQRARKRILDADEIRDVFTALDELHDENRAPECFRSFVQMLFYTASRLRMPAQMTRAEVTENDWIIPAERNKTGLAHLVPLTVTMRALILNDNAPYVFSTDGGKTAFRAFDYGKKLLTARIAENRARDGRAPMPAWVLHDLRRTARFIMGQNGVPTDHAERVLGHVIGGVRAVYDPNLVYAYRKEKLAGLLVLESEIGKALTPPPSATVLPFTARAGA